MAQVLVELKGVQKSYRLGKTVVQALRGIDLTLDAGEFTALVGASGSGKSTLLNIIGCLDGPDAGDVLIGGRDVAHLSEAERSLLRNRHIGFVFQAFNLISVLSVVENVEIPLLIDRSLTRAVRRQRALAALADVDLVSHAKHRPDELSGGQRQRVAIARALVTNPSLVLADEPTANLDSETTRKVVDIMLALNQAKGVTFLFCTHDEKLMARVKKVIHIADGALVDAL